MIRILLVDDHLLVLEGLKRALESEPDMNVVLTACSGEDALAKLKNVAVDVAVVDITMPGMNGVALSRRILEEAPGVRVVALSMYADSFIISEMLKSSARGYVLKDCDTDSLILAIRSVFSGGVYFCEEVGTAVIEDYIKARDLSQDVPESPLTDREKEVLQLLVDGKKVQEIEKSLSISRHTVNTHRSNIMTKLNCSTFVDLIRYCIREGICEE